MIERIRNTLAIFVAGLFLMAGGALAQQAPVVVYESLLDDIFFSDDNGTIAFTELDIAFAPEQLNGAIAVVDAQNKVVKSFPFRSEYRWREGVFGKAQVVGPADIQLTEPGVYNIVALIGGRPVSRLPVGLEQTSAGDDPFNPVKTFRFYGLWAVSGHLTMRESGDTMIPELTFWAGGKDLPEGARGDGFVARLYRGEELIGNSRRTTGYIPAGHYERLTTFINEVHEPGKEVNAKPLTIDAWRRDGQYTLTVSRKKDDQVIRRFRFTVAAGEIVPMPNTQLGYEPGVDYMTPRATRKGSNRYEFVEVIWIDGK